MPIYEYVCQTCAYKFEVKQSIKDEPVATCSRCGKSVNRIISPPAIMFKGTGWYITDYSDKLKPPSGETATTDGAATASKEPVASTTTSSPSSASATTASTGGTSPPGSSGGSTSSN